MKVGRKILAAAVLALPLSLAACGGRTTPRPVYDEAFVNTMIRHMHDEDDRSRLGAVHALAEVPVPIARMAVPALRCLLQDKDCWVREEAARVLRKLDPAASEMLLAIQMRRDRDE